MDRAIDAAAAKQALIGGVDDGLDVEGGDVALDDLNAALHGAHWTLGSRTDQGIARQSAADADEPEDGLTDLIQAMIFHISSSDLTMLPKGGIGPTTFSEPLRV